MTNINQIAWDDTVLPFQLDRSGVRGRVARLDGVLEHILSRHDYPAPVAALVAEVALLTALIGPTIKLRWKLSIQVRGNGAVRTIAADYYAPASEGGPARRLSSWTTQCTRRAPSASSSRACPSSPSSRRAAGRSDARP